MATPPGVLVIQARSRDGVSAMPECARNSSRRRPLRGMRPDAVSSLRVRTAMRLPVTVAGNFSGALLPSICQR